jgi:phosphoglycerate kinase
MSKLSDKLSIDDVDLRGKRVLMRVDFNVPIKDGKVKDTNRIDEALPSIRHALDNKAKAVILMSHLGRPDGRVNKKYSLEPLVSYLSQQLKQDVVFAKDCVGKEAEEAVKNVKEGGVVLLENLRFHLEEEGKGKDAEGKKVKADKEAVNKFRQQLTALGDVYINDAFGTAHRAHSSMVGVQLPVRAAGYLLKKELQAFSKVVEDPQRPYVAIMGGAKVADKIQLISNLLEKVDVMLIGGGMAFTFKHVAEKMPIGSSLFDKEGAKIVPELMAKAQQRGVKLLLPSDFRIGEKFEKNTKVEIVSDKKGIPEGWMGLDIGPQSALAFAQQIWKGRTVVMNGPMGVFEFPAFATGTIQVLQAMASVTQLKQAVTIVGGGDSASAAKDFGVTKLVTHVSTGGGASLELLEGKELPGVKALSNKGDKKGGGEKEGGAGKAEKQSKGGDKINSKL